MKSIPIIIVMGLCIGPSFCSDWEGIIGISDSAVPATKDIVKSDTTGVFIRTLIFGFTKEDTTVDSKDFQRIAIPEEPIDSDTMAAGKPQIPFARLLIAVPDSCEFDITAHASEHLMLEDYLVYPIPRIVFGDSAGYTYFEEVFTYDTTFYETDTLYPGKFYEVASDGHWRDQRVLEVFLYPVQCNPGQELLYFYPGIDLTVGYTGTVVENENGLGPFEGIGREILLNYPGNDNEAEREDSAEVHYCTNLMDTTNVADYIIVTHDAFLDNKTSSGWIDDFGEWRVEHNEFDVAVVKTSDIYSYFPPADSDSLHVPVKDFLTFAYDNWTAPSMPDGHFAYSLFIGDWDYVPTKLDTHTYDTELWLIAHERYYRNLCAGGLDDIMLGRWPVKVTGVQDLVTIAKKTIDYEQSPTLGDWRRRGFFVAGTDQAGPIFNDKVSEAKPYFTDIGYDTLITLYSQIPNDSVIFAEIDSNLNVGEIMASYYGHGGPAGWWGRPFSGHYNDSMVKLLQNDGRLPVVFSWSCLTAMFQWDNPFYDSTHSFPADTSFGEHFLLHDSGGAVAFWGATDFSEIPPEQFLPMRLMLRYQDWILGKALLAGSYYSTYCILGDPALDLGDYTAYPNLPDLVIRPQGIDISLLLPHPYPENGDTIPIQSTIWNIGGTAAYDVKLRTMVVEPDNDTVFIDTVRIDTLLPRDSSVVTASWNPGASHPAYYGEIGDCKFIVTADPDSEITESWEYNNESSVTKKVALYPHKSHWPKKVTGFSQPAIADLNNAGSIEIVYPSSDSLYIFDKDGDVFSGWPKYFKNVYAVVLGDINNNGNVEIVAVSPESIRVYDYRGIVLPGWPKAVPDSEYSFDGFPAIECNPFSTARIIASATEVPAVSSKGKVKIFAYSYNGIPQFEDSATHETDIGGAKFNLMGPSIEEVVSSGAAGKDIVLSYGCVDEMGIPSFYTEVFNDSGSQAIFSHGSNKVIPALFDINDDNYADVIGGAIDGKIRAYDVENNTLLWEHATEGAINSSSSIGDIHPLETGCEITFGNDSTEIHLRKEIDGYTIDPWPYLISPSSIVRSSPAIADINGDTYLDIMVGSDIGYIYAFNYDESIISPFPLPLFGQVTSPIIGDIDGDGESEIIVASSDGFLHVWENRSSEISSYLLEWPQFHHDCQRTGVFGW